MRINVKKDVAYTVLFLNLIFLISCKSTSSDSSSLSNQIYTVTYASENENNINSSDNKSSASFSTEFSSWPIGRNKNIRLSAKSLNGTIVKPGGVFSFNETIGPTDKENGFSIAKVFVKGKEFDGYGGGVCQVSSTLYNAVEQMGLEIIERHSHTKEVTYVSKDKDAAVSYGGIDFKFKNDLDFSIIISTSVEEGILTVNIDKA